MNTPPIQVVESETPDALDPLHPARLRLSQSFAETIGVEEAPDDGLRSAARPRRAFSAHTPDPAYRCDLAVIDLRTDREVYLVTPEVLSELSDEIVPAKYIHDRRPPGRAQALADPAPRHRWQDQQLVGFGAGWCRGRPAEGGSA